MAASDTKKRILEAAQHEFAEHGYHGASIRNIAARAEVKLGAIRYHFGSKDDLFETVIARHGDEVARRRHELEADQDTSDNPLTIEDVVRSIIQPVLDVREETEDGLGFARLMANTVSDPGEQSARVTKAMLDQTTEEIVERLRRAAPGLSEIDQYWSFFLSIGTMAMACRNGDRLVRISQGVCDPDDHDEITQQLVTFAAGGIEALAKRSAGQKNPTD